VITHKKPLSVGLVADICRVSKKTVLNWIYDGGLKAFTTYGGHYRVWPANLKKFLDTTGMDIPFDFVDERTTSVLIIDDDADYAQMLKSAIKAELPTVELTSTDDGYEGLVMIGEIKPQLLILDIRMPKVDGMQVLELLKNRKVDHDMKVLVVSAYLDDKTRKQLKTTVADYALDKLTDVDVLVKTIVALIRSEKPAFLDEHVDK
jgi:two-component system OmpR family response regulator